MINIKEPFYTAGKKYRWPGATIGIGINVKNLEGDGILQITVGKKDDIWEIDKYLAREFVKKYNAYYVARGTRLGVVAWSQFTKQVVEDKTQKLFS